MTISPIESLAISLDGADVTTATENGLVQDCPPANAYTGSRARVLTFDLASGTPCAEYIYEVEPVATAPPSVWTIRDQWLRPTSSSIRQPP